MVGWFVMEKIFLRLNDEKAKVRNLINKDEYQHIFNELKKLPKEINQLIKITNNKLEK